MKTIRKKSLLLNALSNWIALGATIVVSFFLTPFLIKSIGQTSYGIWALLTSIIGMYGLLDMGITSAIGRYGAFYLGENDGKSLNSVYSTSLTIFVVIAVFCFGVSCFLDRPLGMYFKVPAELHGEFRSTLIVFGLSVAGTFLSSVFASMLRAHEMFVSQNIARVVTELARGGLSVFFISRGAGLQGLAIVTLICSGLTLAADVVLTLAFTPHLKFDVRLVKKDTIVKLFSFGLPTAVTIVAAYLRTNLDSIVVGGWVSIAAVTVFVVGSRFSTFLTQFMVSLSGVFDPRFGRYVGENRLQDLEALYRKATTYLTGISFSLSLVLIWIGKALLTAWVGEEFLTAYPVLVILTVGQMLSACTMPTVSLLFALNRHRLLSIVVLGEGVLNLVLSIIFAKLIGMNGVALGTLVPTVIRLFVVFFCLRRAIAIDVRKLLGSMLRPIAVTSLCALSLILFFQPVKLGWFQIGLLSAGVGAVLLVAVNYLGFSSADRIRPLAFFTRVLDRRTLGAK